jgi:hypothetical protein
MEIAIASSSSFLLPSSSFSPFSSFKKKNSHSFHSIKIFFGLYGEKVLHLFTIGKKDAGGAH